MIVLPFARLLRHFIRFFIDRQSTGETLLLVDGLIKTYMRVLSFVTQTVGDRF